MSGYPTDGRDRAPYAGPYAKTPRGGSSGRSLRLDEGPALWDLPRAAPDPEPIPPPLGAPLLILRADGVDYQVDPVHPEGSAERMWRLWIPGIAAVYVAELTDPEAEHAGGGELRGLWCSCGDFAEGRDCGHLRDLVPLGLLRPDRSEWEDADLVVAFAQRRRPGLTVEGGVR